MTDTTQESQPVSAKPALNRVLLAEDDLLTRKLLSRLIEREGLTVVTASDGQAAWQILQQDADFLAAVFDMQMPYLTGLDLVKRMRAEARLQIIPALIVTSRQDTALHAESLTAGTVSFINKPVNPETFQTMLRLLADLGRRRRNS